MIRGTTPEHGYVLPFAEDEIKTFRLIYSQGDEIIMIKEKEDMTVDGNRWSVELTQEETFLFQPGSAYNRIRVLTQNGKSYASEKKRFFVEAMEDEEVMS